jgi:hypothetical protein
MIYLMLITCLCACTSVDGPLEQAVEELIRQAAAKGGKLAGIHIDLDVDFSHQAKLEKSKVDKDEQTYTNQENNDG